MAYWYACDVIKVTAPAGGTQLGESGVRIMPMILVDKTETWTVTHMQSLSTRNVTFGNMRKTTGVAFEVAYETDNPEPEMSLIRTEDPIPQTVIDEVNAVAGGGQFIVHIDTIAERDALYAAYPSLQGRFPDQP